MIGGHGDQWRRVWLTVDGIAERIKWWCCNHRELLTLADHATQERNRKPECAHSHAVGRLICSPHFENPHSPLIIDPRKGGRATAHRTRADATTPSRKCVRARFGARVVAGQHGRCMAVGRPILPEGRIEVDLTPDRQLFIRLDTATATHEVVSHRNTVVGSNHDRFHAIGIRGATVEEAECGRHVIALSHLMHGSRQLWHGHRSCRVLVGPQSILDFVGVAVFVAITAEAEQGLGAGLCSHPLVRCCVSRHPRRVDEPRICGTQGALAVHNPTIAERLFAPRRHIRTYLGRPNRHQCAVCSTLYWECACQHIEHWLIGIVGGLPRRHHVGVEGKITVIRTIVDAERDAGTDSILVKKLIRAVREPTQLNAQRATRAPGILGKRALCFHCHTIRRHVQCLHFGQR